MLSSWRTAVVEVTYKKHQDEVQTRMLVTLMLVIRSKEQAVLTAALSSWAEVVARSRENEKEGLTRRVEREQVVRHRGYLEARLQEVEARGVARLEQMRGVHVSSLERLRSHGLVAETLMRWSHSTREGKDRNATEDERLRAEALLEQVRSRSSWRAEELTRRDAESRRQALVAKVLSAWMKIAGDAMKDHGAERLVSQLRKLGSENTQSFVHRVTDAWDAALRIDVFLEWAKVEGAQRRTRQHVSWVSASLRKFGEYDVSQIVFSSWSKALVQAMWQKHRDELWARTLLVLERAQKSKVRKRCAQLN